VIGTLVHPDGTAAQNVCVILEKGICPIATDDHGVWFTDIPAGPLNWNFIYKINGEEAGRQFIIGSSGGELRLAVLHAYRLGVAGHDLGEEIAVLLHHHGPGVGALDEPLTGTSQPIAETRRPSRAARRPRRSPSMTGRPSRRRRARPSTTARASAHRR